MKFKLLKRSALVLGLGGSAFAFSGCTGVSFGVGYGYGYDPFYDSMLWNDYYRRDVNVNVDVDRPNRPDRPDRPNKPDRPAKPDRPKPPAGKPPSRPKPPVAKPPARPRPPVARPPSARPPIHRPSGGGRRR